MGIRKRVRKRGRNRKAKYRPSIIEKLRSHFANRLRLFASNDNNDRCVFSLACAWETTSLTVYISNFNNINARLRTREKYEMRRLVQIVSAAFSNPSKLRTVWI
jgi:trehalose-6-phosphatase